MSFAESCTAGAVSAFMAEADGASEVLLGGIVAYSNKSKIEMLGVEPETIERHGAVSRETALEMARRIRAIFGSDMGISTTGVFGEPVEGQPAGTVFLAVTTRERVFEKELSLSGTRLKMKEQTVEAALALLRYALGQSI